MATIEDNTIDQNAKENPEPRREFMKRSGMLAAALSFPAGMAAAAPKKTGASEIVQAEATQLSSWIRNRQVSCREVMVAFLDQIDRINPKVNAIISLRDRETLLKEADQRDDDLKRKIYRGWMHGFPQAPKDLTNTAGIPTTQGSPLLKNFIPKQDSIIVERIRKNGAILIGKTNTPEFGMGSVTYNTVFGTTLNAYDQTKNAGGSSGGTAVALATRMLPVADGSDMMGSLRNPAAYNNIFGFRPSFNRVPFGPSSEVFMQQLGYEGPMGRTVTDLSMLLSVQAGFDPRLPRSSKEDPSIFAKPLKRNFKGVKVAWMGDYNGYLTMEPGVIDLCKQGLKGFEDIGCIVEAAVPDFSMEKLWQTWLTHRHFLMAGIGGPLYQDPAKRALMKPEAIWEVEGGLTLTGPQIFQASVDRTAWHNALLKMFEKYEYLILPTAQTFPFDSSWHWAKEINGKPMDTYHRWMEVVIGATLAGLPVISVPVGFNANGLPMGVQVIGKPQDDLSVLQVAYAYEQATRWVQKRPPALI